jgi:uncharacterized protein (TIGR01777 family)
MHVVVTGGTGLIGSHLVRRLRERGDEATVVSRNPEGSDEIGWDPGEEGSLELPAETDAVVHLAGAPIVGQRWTEDHKRAIRDSRVQGTRRVVQAVREHGDVDHVVSGSAVGYYGDRGEERLAEDADPGQDFLAEVTRSWEDEARPLSEDEQAPGVAWIRTGIVLSTEDGALAEMLNPLGPVKPFHWGLGGPVGSGEQWFPWIHVGDEVRAITFLLDERLEGRFNLAAPGIVRNATFIDAIGDVLGRPTKLPVPKPALRLLYGEAADLLFASQKVVPDRLEDEGFTFRYPDVHEALEDLLGEGSKPETEPREAQAVT